MEWNEVPSTYRGYKLLDPKLMVCTICHKAEPNLSTINTISGREKQNIFSICKHLGLRELSEKYNFNYPEDRELKINSYYLNRNTGTFELWTICNCELRVHPDCFLQSLKINMKYKCDVCNEIYKIGYQVQETHSIFKMMILNIILIVALLAASVVFFTTKASDKSIIALRACGLITLVFLLVLLAFLFLETIRKSRIQFKAFLLPYSYKYDLTYGFKKIRIVKSFQMGSSRRLEFGSKENYTQSQYQTRDTEENMVDYDLNCPFYNEVMMKLKRCKTAIDRKQVMKNIDFDYEILEPQVVKRFIIYIQSVLNINSLEDLTELKIDRVKYFNHIIRRNFLLLEVFNVLTKEIQCPLNSSQIRRNLFIGKSSKSNNSYNLFSLPPKKGKASTQLIFFNNTRGTRQRTQVISRETELASIYSQGNQPNKSMNTSRIEDKAHLKYLSKQSLVNPFGTKRLSKLNDSYGNDNYNSKVIKRGVASIKRGDISVDLKRNSIKKKKMGTDISGSRKLMQRKVKFSDLKVIPQCKESMAEIATSRKLESLNVEHQDPEMDNPTQFQKFNIELTNHLNKSSSSDKTNSFENSKKDIFEFRSQPEDSIRMPTEELDIIKKTMRSSSDNLKSGSNHLIKLDFDDQIKYHTACND